jgi:ATP-binding protein involved in chromosome partitioning
VMSIGLLLTGQADPVIWRGPRKHGVIRQFLKDVAWGRLDYLVIDSPPGTGDEPLSVAQLVGAPAGAVIVTTPQDLAIADVRRCVSFCRALSLPVLGIVENMSGFVCPACGHKVDLFKAGGGAALAEELHLPLLGQIPIDPQIVSAGDAGRPFLDTDPDGATVSAFADVVQAIVARGLEQADAALQPVPAPSADPPRTPKKESRMKIAIPLAGGRLSLHFGHCEEFAVVEVDPQSKQIVGQALHQSPPHEPGALPRWLNELGVQVILAGGMGQRAQQLLAASGIQVVIGAPAETPEGLVAAYLRDELQTGENICDH